MTMGIGGMDTGCIVNYVCGGVGGSKKSRQAAESAFSWLIPQLDYWHVSLHCMFLLIAVAAVLVVVTGPAAAGPAGGATGPTARGVGCSDTAISQGQMWWRGWVN